MKKQKNAIIGIYKITSPSGKIYIGQSVNIDERKKVYKRINSLVGQPKIYRSINKYGFENHTHEIIEICSIEQLDERETFWKKYYLEQVNNDWQQVLFCELYDNGGGPKSEKTKLKMRKPRSEEAKKNMKYPKSDKFKEIVRLAHIGKPKLAARGILRSDESKLKMSLSRMGQSISEETKIKMSLAKKGKPNLNKGIPKSEEFKKHMRKPCVIKGVEYISRWEAAEILGVTANDVNHWILNPKPKYDDCYWLHK